ncbi:MAG: S41 family peptidase [Acidaminococcaceae bacterium]|nr:S41 family peptidase [Acidaminococcaceae bacterium]
MLKKRFSFLSLIIVCVVSVAVFFGLSVYWLNANIGSASEIFKLVRTMQLVQEKFVGNVDRDQLYTGALRGIVKSLDDPHSVYLDKKDYESLSTMTEGHFGGVGIVLGMKDNKFIVVAPIENTPAFRGGIKAGDYILAIDGEEIHGQDMMSIVNKIRGKDGSVVEILVQTGTNTPRIVRIVRSEIKIQSVIGHMKENDIGYIRISSFNESTAADFAAKYHELENSGMKGTILDLRGNPGGLLWSGVGVAKLIVPKGPIVSVIEKNGKTLTEYSTLTAVKYPMAVLVDNGTASAAEIVAGALQDTKAAKLFGTKTYGKGSVQTVFNLGSDTALKLTMAKYYTPSGRSINGVGIEPDELIEATDEKGNNQLEAALSYVAQEIQKSK